LRKKIYACGKKEDMFNFQNYVKIIFLIKNSNL